MRQPLRCVLTIVAGLLAALTFLPGAQAQSSFEAAVSGFAADSFLDTDKAIGAVAATGSPMALPVLQALKDGRLFFTTDPQGVYFRDEAGALFDAGTEKPVDPAPADLKTVRLNNRVRGTLAAAEAELQRFNLTRIHRTRLANLDRVTHVEMKPSGDFELTFETGATVQGSRRYKTPLEKLDRAATATAAPATER